MGQKIIKYLEITCDGPEKFGLDDYCKHETACNLSSAQNIPYILGVIKLRGWKKIKNKWYCPLCKIKLNECKKIINENKNQKRKRKE